MGKRHKQKNRKKKNTKRNQKEAAKKAARKVINRQARVVAQQMRRGMARRSAEVDMPPQDRFELEEKAEFVPCSGIGECCKGRMVKVSPYDVWQIMGNEDVKREYGVEMTTDLFKSPEERGLLHYWLDTRTGWPTCAIRKDAKLGDEEHCAFLQKDEEGKFSCFLGDDRPTICRSNPIGRVGKKDEEKRLAGWEYVLFSGPCEDCSSAEGIEPCEIMISDWLEKRDMKQGYELSELYFGYVGWVAREIKAEEMKQLATMMIFDWDRFAFEMGGISKEEVIENRPTSPEQVLVGARMMLDGIMKGRMGQWPNYSEQIDQEEKQNEEQTESDSDGGVGEATGDADSNG